MKKIIIALATITSVQVYAAAVKSADVSKNKTQTAAPVAPVNEVKTLKPMLNADLKGLSLYASYDMTDSFDFNASAQNQSVAGTYDSDKAIGFGAQYMITQLDNGLAFDVGGTYEMSRELSTVKASGNKNALPSPKPEIQFWTMYGQASALLTPKFGIFAGGNYNIPQIKNVPNGTWKGKLGYFFGATFQATNKFAIDAEMRTLNLAGSSEQNGVTTTYDNIRLQGFNFRGRYSF